MTVAYDATSVVTATNTNTTSLTHTCTGDERLLVVSVCLEHATVVPTSVTFAGVAMTNIDGYLGFGNLAVTTFVLWAPSTVASSTLSVTLSGVVPVVIVHANSFTGVETIASKVMTTGSSDTPAVTSTGLPGDYAVDVFAAQNSTATVGSGQTQRTNATGTFGGTVVRAGTSTKLLTNHSASTSWTLDPSRHWTAGSIVLKPASKLGGSPILVTRGELLSL